MAVSTTNLTVHTSREGELVNITEEAIEAVRESKIQNGTATLFVIGSTAALTTIEYEPGLLEDLPAILERIAPKGIEYRHEERWHDGNGHSHIKASLIGPSITIPIVKGQLTLGTWQQIVLVELDIQARSRRIVVQVVGD